MDFFRKNKKTIIFLLVIGFSFATVELHADHDANDSEQSQHCCVQCCPTHNLAPAPKEQGVFQYLLSLRNLTPVLPEVTLSIFPKTIFRPPIHLV